MLDDLLEKEIIKLQSQTDPKKLERAPMPNTISIKGWLIIVLKKAAQLMNASCGFPKTGR